MTAILKRVQHLEKDLCRAHEIIGKQATELMEAKSQKKTNEEKMLELGREVYELQREINELTVEKNKLIAASGNLLLTYNQSDTNREMLPEDILDLVEREGIPQ